MWLYTFKYSVKIINPNSVNRAYGNFHITHDNKGVKIINKHFIKHCKDGLGVIKNGFNYMTR